MAESTNLSELQGSKKQRRSMQELDKLPPKQRVAAFLEDNRAQIVAALPKHVSPDRMLQVAQTAVTQTPALLECFTPSLYGSLIKCTQLGLEPNNALGQLYLIPFNNRKERRKDVQVIIGYRGMIDLARRSGAIKSIWADAVREGDEFEYERGMNDVLRHREVSDGGKPGAITHFYAYAHLKDGGFVFDVKSIEWMNTHMLTTQSKGAYGPWKDHYEQMGRKTMVRRLFNYLPVSIEMAEAQAIDATGASVTQNMDRTLQGEYSVMDEVGAIENESDAAMETAAAPADLSDGNGEIFDPEIHLATASGMPMYNQDDTFRKKPQRAADKANSQNSGQESSESQESEQTSAEKPESEQGEMPPDVQAAADDALDAERGSGGEGDGEISVE